MCKYVKSRLCEVLICTSSAWFHVKKTTKPSAAASSLSRRDNWMHNCFHNLSLKISIFIWLELNGFSPFSHTFPSVDNKSRGCSQLSAAASAWVTGCTCSCKVCCWETQWPESLLLPSPGPEHINLCLRLSRQTSAAVFPDSAVLG